MLGIEITDLLTIAPMLLLGGFMQGTVGFASGMLMVPLLVTCGFSLPEAATVSLVSSAIQNGWGAYQLHHKVTWDEVRWPILLRTISIPLGALVLYQVGNLEPKEMKQVVGGLILSVLIMLWVFRIEPKETLGRGWEALAFLVSGFLFGLATVGGGPMVIYLNALHWSADKSRAFMYVVSIAGAPLVALLWGYKYGAEILPVGLATFLLFPLALLAMRFGMRLGARLPKERFRRLTTGILVFIAISAIVSPMLLEESKTKPPTVEIERSKE